MLDSAAAGGLLTQIGAQLEVLDIQLMQFAHPFLEYPSKCNNFLSFSSGRLESVFAEY